MLKRIKRAPLAVDRHLRVAWDSPVFELGDVLDVLHVGGVAAGAEDDGNLGVGVDVVRGDERPGCVVDERGEGHRDILLYRAMRRGTWACRRSRGTCIFLDGLAEHFCNVASFGIGCAKAFRPADKFAMINLVLSVKEIVRDVQSSSRNTHEHGYEN